MLWNRRGNQKIIGDQIEQAQCSVNKKWEIRIIQSIVKRISRTYS